MRKALIALALAAALPLAACSTDTSVESASAAVVLSANQAYANYINGLTAQVQAGTLSREDFRSKESTAYAALLLVRAGQMTTTTFTALLK